MGPDSSAVRNAADARQVKAARKRNRKQRLEEVADLRAILALPSGRRFVWRLLGSTELYQSLFSRDIAALAFAEGKRRIGLLLLADINEADPTVLPEMMKELMPSADADDEDNQTQEEEPNA